MYLKFYFITKLFKKLIYKKEFIKYFKVNFIQSK